jgi:hypothetical protein
MKVIFNDGREVKGCIKVEERDDGKTITITHSRQVFPPYAPLYVPIWVHYAPEEIKCIVP